MPIEKNERSKEIKIFEKKSNTQKESQIFIETPYRNNKLLKDLIRNLSPVTSLCIACDLTLKTEYIRNLEVKDWKKVNVNLNKQPTIFIFKS